MSQEQPSCGPETLEISHSCTERIHKDTKFARNMIYSALLLISIVVTMSVFLMPWSPQWRSQGQSRRVLSDRTEAQLLQLSPGYCCTECEFHIHSHQMHRSLHTARGYLLERILLHQCSAWKQGVARTGQPVRWLGYDVPSQKWVSWRQGP